MTPEQAAGLVCGILAGLAAVLSALATVIQAIRVDHRIDNLGRNLNGRLDALLAEREARVRAEALIETERVRAASLTSLGQTGRPEPVIERRPPGEAH